MSTERARINVILRSEQSGGQLAVMDNVVPAGFPGPPLHHHDFDEHGLVDEYRMWVHPVVWGSGERLFNGADDETFLRLVDTTTFGSGVVVLSCRPAGSE